ncbi:MAG: galactokinase [Pirellulales bacterium]|nr:galactokinase [Pirellulales bacterium]
MDEALSLADLAARTADSFQQRFGRPAQFVVAAPGRVNLIGEHTDYNDGFVLPMAIDRYTVLAADHAEGEVATIFSSTVNDQFEIPLSGGSLEALPGWTRYIRGVFDAYSDEGIKPVPFEGVIDSTVPLGGGLSSSAALEVATATLIEAMTGKAVTPVRKGLLCQRAEHEGAGVPCGIMDQFSSVLCQAGHLMLLDCRDQQTKMVPLTDPSFTVLIINTNVKHELTGGEYAERRQQCEEAAKKLGVASLREATLAMLEEHQSQLEEVLYRRARHVIGEIERTTQAADAIEASRWDEVGRLMFASHASLRDDYEVSCTELDVLVRLAEELGSAKGVVGSRMTGGGFGGCTVSLVKTSAAAEIAEAICRAYQQETGIEPTAFSTPPAQGATILTPSGG